MYRNHTSMTSNKLFIWNLNRQVRRQELKDFFSQWGEVAFASVSLDRESDRSRWFWFITFVNEEDAIKAKEEATWQMLQERELFIDFARPKPEHEETPTVGEGEVETTEEVETETAEVENVTEEE